MKEHVILKETPPHAKTVSATETARCKEPVTESRLVVTAEGEKELRGDLWKKALQWQISLTTDQSTNNQTHANYIKFHFATMRAEKLQILSIRNAAEDAERRKLRLCCWYCTST